MAKFKVCVEEVYFRELIVEAENANEACDKVHDSCNAGEIEVTQPSYFCDRTCDVSSDYGSSPLTDEEYEYERKYCECI